MLKRQGARCIRGPKKHGKGKEELYPYEGFDHGITDIEWDGLPELVRTR